MDHPWREMGDGGRGRDGEGWDLGIDRTEHVSALPIVFDALRKASTKKSPSSQPHQQTPNSRPSHP